MWYRRHFIILVMAWCFPLVIHHPPEETEKPTMAPSAKVGLFGTSSSEKVMRDEGNGCFCKVWEVWTCWYFRAFDMIQHPDHLLIGVSQLIWSHLRYVDCSSPKATVFFRCSDLKLEASKPLSETAPDSLAKKCNFFWCARGSVWDPWSFIAGFIACSFGSGVGRWIRLLRWWHPSRSNLLKEFL